MTSGNTESTKAQTCSSTYEAISSRKRGVPPLPVTELGRFSRGALDAALQEDLPAYADQGLPVPETNLLGDSDE
ncbi:hypothetical protein EDB86DRAFT_3097210 [Lactarius hatsudake]|nr:hypothetical protein EDB86DRAFT_3097210 [Lactarius hatsudake]